MHDIKPFIDSALRCVGITNELVRVNGNKNAPKFFNGLGAKFWSSLDQVYNPEAKGEAIPLTGAVITGRFDDSLTMEVIGIDMDDQATFNLMMALDPEYEYIFLSQGKSQGGGSALYLIPDEWNHITEKAQIHNDYLQLDILTNHSLMYLPTSGNKTKVEWEQEKLEDMPLLRKPSEKMIKFVSAVYDLYKRGSRRRDSTGNATNGEYDKNYMQLAPFMESSIVHENLDKELFKRLTPYSMRDLPAFTEKGYVTGDDVPKSRGNEYFTSVLGVLAKDLSVSKNMSIKFCHYINQLWSDKSSVKRPYPRSEIERMVAHAVSRPEWKYDPSWKSKIATILTEYNSTIDLYYDPLTLIYNAIDSKLGLQTFSSVDKVPKHLNSVNASGRIYKTSEVHMLCSNKQTVVTALEPYGDLPMSDSNIKRFNVFNRPKKYDILLHPSKYIDEFEGQVPETTIKFFEHLIPDQDTRDYVLSFVLTKLLTMEFSPVILYFLGMSGAGKNLFFVWLKKFLENKAQHTTTTDHQLCVNVEPKVFLDKYNLWMLNAIFINLDEYGERLDYKSSQEVLAILKSMSGSDHFQLRAMGGDPRDCTHNVTAILTANINKLAPDINDRRFVMIDTPRKLSESEMVLPFKGESEAIEKMFEEQDLWAYYWVTHYDKLSPDEYRKPPLTPFKEQLIFKHLPPAKRLINIVENQRRSELIDICEDFGFIDRLIEEGKYGYLSKKLFTDIYLTMVDGPSATPAYINKELRDSNLDLSGRFRWGKKTGAGFPFPMLKYWAEGQATENDFEPILKDI